MIIYTRNVIVDFVLLSNGEMQFEALDKDIYLVLYAGQPHNVSVFHHAPFVADSMEDIAKLYREFRQGEFPHLKICMINRKSLMYKNKTFQFYIN